MIWQVTLSNDEKYDESSITTILPNPSNVTPWLLLQSYCDHSKLTIKSIVLWDNGSAIRLYSPGRVATKPYDAIDFRRRYVSTSMTSNVPKEITGILITKNNVTFGIWCDAATKEIFSSIEG